MTFSIYALLGHGAPVITDESLASDLERFFRNEEGVSIKLEQLPFAKNKTVALRWAAWLVRVSYEEGDEVAQDSVNISEMIDSPIDSKISSIDKRIRVVFSNDDTKEYTNQVIYLMDFLREIPGAIIFDPQQRDLVK